MMPSLPSVNRPLPTYKAGPKGSKLLRIKSDKVLELMEHDDELAASISNMLLKNLQRKLDDLLMREVSQKYITPTRKTSLETAVKGFI